MDKNNSLIPLNDAVEVKLKILTTLSKLSMKQTTLLFVKVCMLLLLVPISVEADADYFESSPQSVNIYQGMTADTMKILYNLDPKEGADGKTYIPIDMGYGVAWADRNVGADDNTATSYGSYFRWGDSNAANYSLGAHYKDWKNIVATNNDFAQDYDMARGNMGTNWRMPSKSDFEALIANSTISENNKFTNQTDNSKYIIFPATGNYLYTRQFDGDLQYYWTKTYGGTISKKYCVYCLVRTGTNAYKVAYSDATNSTDIGSNWGITVRAIYVPAYPTCTLIINVGTKKYQYICQEGQKITVTANATVEGYVFDEWKMEDGTTTDETDTNLSIRTFTMTGNITRTATFKRAIHLVLVENGTDDHYDDFADKLDGKTATTVTLNRKFEQGRWSTICLPFEVSGGMMTTLKMSGRVYEFKYATGNANVGEGVNLYFSNVKKMEAGKCYIVNADKTLSEKKSFVFNNVTVDVSKDLGEALNSKEAYDRLSIASGYKTKGDIELVGTLRNGTLIGSSTEGNTYMGLKGNQIYYPNTDSGSTIWAYRGIFHSSETLDIKNMQKMRIIVDGEDRGEIRVEDGEIIDADGDVRALSDDLRRKFIRDGVLYIERNGVNYDAQGKRVESL